MAKKYKLDDNYSNVRLEIEDGKYILSYTPKIPHGRSQRMGLDADTASDARFEAACFLECDESELPEIEES